MDPTSRIRLSLGFVSTAISMIFGMDRGRKTPLSPGAIEVLYSSYFSRVRMGDIGGMLDISPSSATDLVNYLEREGFMRRIQDENNRRSILVVPTEKGEEWILETEEKMYGFLETGLSRLKKDEQLLFADLCTRFSGVYDNFSFLACVKAFKEDRGSVRVPLITRKNGRLLRLEEVVDARYCKNDVMEKKEDSMIFETRVPETCDGIQDEVTVEQYDEMQRGLRDEGHMPIEELVKFSQPGDNALEVGPGPGYLGLEWLKHTKDTNLTGLEISPAMIRMAEKNAKDYHLSDRATYREGNALAMPFSDGTFDLAFSNGSLHEWEDPKKVFSEILRVLKPGGRVSVSDLKRDLSPEIYRFMLETCEGSEIRKGFETSVHAAYVQEELEKMLGDVGFSWLQVITHPYGLVVIGKK
ncbi:MAG: methyltransferase domain-containing protein [Methanomicrobiales archaeon]|nr:methyltransferase domain-containing protein [Methanomicrobiales archaeon]